MSASRWNRSDEWTAKHEELHAKVREADALVEQDLKRIGATWQMFCDACLDTKAAATMRKKLAKMGFNEQLAIAASDAQREFYAFSVGN